MHNKKKLIGITVVVLVLAALIGSLSYYRYVNKYKGTALEPMENMINSLYFNKGDYNSYSNSFTAPNKALNVQQFDQQKKTAKPSKEFRYGSKDTRDILSHMRVVEKNNKALVYYLKDVKDDSELKKSSFWTIVKKDGKWLIKND